MEIEVSYRYSKLDNEKQFGIKILDEREIHQVYIRWVYYYLGAFLGIKSGIRIYPFSLKDDVFKGKVLKKYKYCNDAKRQAKLIFNKIIKTL